MSTIWFWAVADFRPEFYFIARIDPTDTERWSRKVENVDFSGFLTAAEPDGRRRARCKRYLSYVSIYGYGLVALNAAITGYSSRGGNRGPWWQIIRTASFVSFSGPMN